MKNLRLLLFISVVFGGISAAQSPGLPSFNFGFLFPNLQQYLAITAAQTASMNAINQEYNDWARDKVARIYQVELEINDETAKNVLDPLALGIRYAEIQAICRDAKEKANIAVQKAKGVLTEEQKTKIAALETAQKLMPVITEAQGANLLPSQQTLPPVSLPSFTFGNASGSIFPGSIIALGGFSNPFPGCGPPFPYSAAFIFGPAGSMPDPAVNQQKR
jgi:hypothetical protein